MPWSSWVVSFECQKVKSLQAKDLCFALFRSRRPRHLNLIVIQSSDNRKKGVHMLPMYCRKPSQLEISTRNHMSLILGIQIRLRCSPQILPCKVEARSKTSPSRPRSASYPRSTWWWFLSSRCLLMISPGCRRHNVTTFKPRQEPQGHWSNHQIKSLERASKARPTNSTLSPTCSVAWSQLCGTGHLTLW